MNISKQILRRGWAGKKKERKGGEPWRKESNQARLLLERSEEGRGSEREYILLRGKISVTLLAALALSALILSPW